MKTKQVHCINGRKCRKVSGSGSLWMESALNNSKFRYSIDLLSSGGRNKQDISRVIWAPSIKKIERTQIFWGGGLDLFFSGYFYTPGY